MIAHVHCSEITHINSARHSPSSGTAVSAASWDFFSFSPFLLGAFLLEGGSKTHLCFPYIVNIWRRKEVKLKNTAGTGGFPHTHLHLYALEIDEGGEVGVGGRQTFT